jgi:hypothetical protein
MLLRVFQARGNLDNLSSDKQNLVNTYVVVSGFSSSLSSLESQSHFLDGLLIPRGNERESGLSAAEAINRLCIFVAAVGIIGTLGAGLDRIFDPYFYELLLAAGALAFHGLFLHRQKRGEESRKAQTPSTKGLRMKL